MKTPEQILKKIEQKGFDTDVLGWAMDDLIKALPFEYAKQFLKDEVTKEEFEKFATLTDETVLATIADYIPFAEGKIINERGLSADRSCQHFIAWFWLIDEEFSDKLRRMYLEEYGVLGRPIFEEVCKYLKDKGIKYLHYADVS